MPWPACSRAIKIRVEKIWPKPSPDRQYLEQRHHAYSPAYSPLTPCLLCLLPVCRAPRHRVSRVRKCALCLLPLMTACLLPRDGSHTHSRLRRISAIACKLSSSNGGLSRVLRKNFPTWDYTAWNSVLWEPERRASDGRPRIETDDEFHKAQAAEACEAAISRLEPPGVRSKRLWAGPQANAYSGHGAEPKNLIQKDMAGVSRCK